VVDCRVGKDGST